MELPELTPQQKVWVASGLEYYKGPLLSEYTRGCIMGLIIGILLTGFAFLI